MYTRRCFNISFLSLVHINCPDMAFVTVSFEVQDHQIDSCGRTVTRRIIYLGHIIIMPIVAIYTTAKFR